MKKDYIDEHDEWQKHQFDLGHFTGGRIPVWIKNPGNRKGLGAALLILGLFHGGWTAYSLMQIFQEGQTAESLISAILTGFFTVVFVLAGIKLLKKSKL